MYSTADYVSAAGSAQRRHGGDNTMSQGSLEMCKLIEGEEYVYTGTYPSNCAGQRYRLVRFVIDLPSYQQKVLVEGVTGPDRGKAFVLSEAVFANKFEIAPQVVESLGVRAMPPDHSKPVGKVAGAYHKGSGV